jgi:DNA polymerase III subunit gamma/tau
MVAAGLTLAMAAGLGAAIVIAGPASVVALFAAPITRTAPIATPAIVLPTSAPVATRSIARPLPLATARPEAAQTIVAAAAAPTAEPILAPTVASTLVSTAAPTGAPTAAPTGAPTAAPTEAPTAGPVEAWQATQPLLDAVWTSDTTRAIEILDDFLVRFPDDQQAREKLYAALIADAEQLNDRRALTRAQEQLDRAQQLLPDRPEAAAARESITATIAEPNPPRPASVDRAPAQPPAAPAPALARPPAPPPTPTKVPFVPPGGR